MTKKNALIQGANVLASIVSGVSIAAIVVGVGMYLFQVISGERPLY